MGQQHLDLDCCNDSTPTNPKRDLWARKARSKSMALFDVQNPIPGECEDDAKTEQFFKEFPFIPYAGSRLESGHKLLDLYINLEKLSPTHGACIQKKTAYAVGGRVKIVNAIDPVWNIGVEQTQPTVAEQIAYRDAVNQFFEFKGGLQKFHEFIANNYQAVGEAYVEMKWTEFMGQTKISLKVHGKKKVLPADVEGIQYDIYGVSDKWTVEHLKKNPPRLVPGFPEYSQDDEGVFHTMFFLKAGDYEYHGRPESQQADIYKYREMQDSIYVTKQAAHSFVPTLIIEVEAGEPGDGVDEDNAQAVGFDEFAGQFQDNYSQKSERPQGVVITERPYGAKPMTVHEVQPNTNEAFYQTMGDIAIGHITRAHSVTPRFIGKESSNGFSENAYLQDYLTNVAPAIDRLRETVTDFTNGILNACWDKVNQPKMKEYSITFDNPIQAMIDAYNTQQTGNTQNVTNNTL